MINRTVVFVVTFLVLLVPLAVDAAQRTFVSAGSGSDANPCTRALPCRGFAAAISQTDPGGEVVVLDTGGYGPVDITQSVALIAPPGVHAAITAFSGNAIDINAGSSDVVILRGLYLNGLGGVSGVDFASGQTLHLENLVLSGFTVFAVFAHSSGADIYVSDTVSRQSGYGFVFESAGATIRASLDSIHAEENSNGGVTAAANSLVTVTRSVAGGNGLAGFNSAIDSGVMNVESCTATMNLVGILTVGTARVRNSMITGNTTGVDGTGTTISFGNNGLHGNGTDGTFTSSVAQQ